MIYNIDEGASSGFAGKGFPIWQVCISIEVLMNHGMVQDKNIPTSLDMN